MPKISLTKREAREIHDAMIFWRERDCCELSPEEIDTIILKLERSDRPAHHKENADGKA